MSSEEGQRSVHQPYSFPTSPLTPVVPAIPAAVTPPSYLGSGGFPGGVLGGDVGVARSSHPSMTQLPLPSFPPQFPQSPFRHPPPHQPAALLQPLEREPLYWSPPLTHTVSTISSYEDYLRQVMRKVHPTSRYVMTPVMFSGQRCHHYPCQPAEKTFSSTWSTTSMRLPFQESLYQKGQTQEKGTPFQAPAFTSSPYVPHASVVPMPPGGFGSQARPHVSPCPHPPFTAAVPSPMRILSAPSDKVSPPGKLDWVMKVHALCALDSQRCDGGSTVPLTAPAAAVLTPNFGVPSAPIPGVRSSPSFQVLERPGTTSSSSGGYLSAPSTTLQPTRHHPPQPRPETSSLLACRHDDSKRLRSKKGCGYYVCCTCGMRWKVPSHAPVRRGHSTVASTTVSTSTDSIKRWYPCPQQPTGDL